LILGPNFVGLPRVEITDLVGNVVANGSLGVGEYFLIVFDGNNCVTGQTGFSVIEPTAIEVDIQVVNEDCDNGGSINLDIRGGNGPYTVDWADIAGTNDVEDRVDIPSGAYTATITDANGCTTFTGNINIANTCNCDAIAGTLMTSSDTLCLDMGPVEFEAQLDDIGVLPFGFASDYFLTQGNTIVEIGDTSIFTITTPGTYTINRFIYNPAQLNLNTFTPGTTSIFDVNTLLAQGGGQFCGALGLQGATVEAIFCGNTSSPTTTDTVNLVLPVNTTDSICVVLEPGFDLMNSTFTLAAGGTTGVSSFGSWTISPQGCLIYTANGTPGVTVDTITVIVTNTNGGVDTTVVFVTITDGTMTGCLPIITTGTFDVTTSDCANGGTYCLDIPFDNINDFNLSDNGGIYTGGFRGCDFMMTLETNMTSFFANVDPRIS